MYEKTFESTKLVIPGGAGSSNWTQMIYVTPWDAFFCACLWEWARVFRDGTKVSYATPSGSYVPVPRVGGYVAFYRDGRIYTSYEIDQLPNPNEVLNPDWAIPYGLAPAYPIAGAFIDDLNQRYVRPQNANVLGVYDLKSGALLGSITHNAGEYFKTIAWVQEGQVAGICTDNGKVKIMDYLSGLCVVEAGRIDPHRVAAYDNAFNLAVSIGTDHKTRVYCREAWPYSLSNPVFEPAQVYGLKANTVKVRLSGQEGEPCPGWWVHWALEGVAPVYGDPHGPPVFPGAGDPLGYLDKYVSQTDQDGYAWNLFFGPDDNAVGQCKLRTWVVLN